MTHKPGRACRHARDDHGHWFRLHCEQLPDFTTPGAGVHCPQGVHGPAPEGPTTARAGF